MIKMIAAACRKPGMTHKEYIAYIQNVHGKLTTDNPVTLRRYVQNHVFDSAFGSAAETTHVMPVSRDSVVELVWDSPEDMKTTFSHDYVKTKVGPDGKNFADQKATLSMVAEEVELPVASPASGCDAKVIHFLKAADGIDLQTYFSRWVKAHEIAISTLPDTAGPRRYVQNRNLPAFNPILAYFGGEDMVIYEGAAALWYDSAEAAEAFRDYETVLMRVNADPATAFYDPSRSFFVYAREVPIYERHPA
ncbi:EthD domain-containing protein [Rhizobium sp. L1K21]|uniref:EthD domain-containing protein n=1 Tax=Rhizobium sp. L1K21 TaxID=2954933 RepID=UPI002093C911|nr:EthD domain-containing protein [Rhizobium sp. L1K21]MCO6188453.1 EthD domain-containing protein [Rhizobium sp. L1K21]